MCDVSFKAGSAPLTSMHGGKENPQFSNNNNKNIVWQSMPNLNEKDRNLSYKYTVINMGMCKRMGKKRQLLEHCHGRMQTNKCRMKDRKSPMDTRKGKVW